MSPEAYVQMHQIESLHWWFVGRRAICSDLISSFAVSSHLKILEVGCGTGGNLQMLSYHGEVSAFEMDEQALKFAINKSNKSDIRLGSCPDSIPFNIERFDLICMFDVLEHIADDLESLKKLKGLLKPSGLIIITVPAYDWLYGPHDTFLHHKRRYTKSSLKNQTNLAGLQEIKMTYFNSFLFPLILLIRFGEKLFMPKIGTIPIGSEVPAKLINRILGILFSLERYLIRSSIYFLFGASILGVFKINNKQSYL
jgi:SAM-dependent methyltransferase